MVSRLSYLRRGTLLGSVVQLLSGRSVAMGIAVVTAPVVARIFTPDDYGAAALFLAAASIAAVVMPLGYQRAIFFPKDDVAAARLLVLSLAVIVLWTIATMAAVTLLLASTEIGR